MNRRLFVCLTALLAFTPPALAQEKSIVVASTTSTQDSGLFEHLLPLFKAKTGNNITSRIYYRLSSDGGVSWGPQEQISNVTSFEPTVLPHRGSS